ncbi:uncharacterized protein LOC135351302 [Halichondria panicea]|uniref:uncharacterized protein LOC135351302 n=1 Tax=Halichondria panicea TaxID=6063 RepID=UPI00312B3024
MHYIICLLALLYCQTNAQQCLCATNGNRDLPNFVRPGGGLEPRFRDNPIQVIITSYRFDCCGVVTEWRALVEKFTDQSYTIFFQVWRPNSPSPMDTDGCYTMQGTNYFSPISLGDRGTDDRGIVTGVPLESERIEVQPGDVVGFYLESSIRIDDGIQFARDANLYTDETVWFATGSLTPRPEATCMYPVGTSGLLSSSTNLAPLITATVSTAACPITGRTHPHPHTLNISTSCYYRHKSCSCNR